VQRLHQELQAVEALAPYRLRTTWTKGEVLDVDVEAALRGIPALTSLVDRFRAVFSFNETLAKLPMCKRRAASQPH
jgi:hypothetical protein